MQNKTGKKPKIKQIKTIKNVSKLWDKFKWQNIQVIGFPGFQEEDLGGGIEKIH